MVAKVNAASVPRSERILGRATCLATDLVGDCVYVTAPRVGNLYQVAKVDIAVGLQMPAVGVVAKKYAPTDCVVHFHGPLRSIFSGLVPGRSYFVGTDGRPARPGDPTYPVLGGANYFQQIGVATSSNELLVIPLEVSLGGPGGGGVRYHQQLLVGPINGINTVFTVPISFTHGGVFTESLYFNGQLLLEGVGNDYVASESGGPGTGHDTITTLFVAKTGQRLSLDFTPAP